MQNKFLWGVVALNLLATAAVGYHVFAGKEGASGDAAIKEYIANHPQEIIDSVNTHMQSQQAAGEEQMLEKVKANHAFLYEDDRHPSLGDKNASFTVIEFLDYNCGYCKKAYEAVTKVLENDKNVRFVLIEIPILHESSALAAKWALAAHDADGYTAFHKKLMEHKGPITEEILAGFAKDAGLNVDKIKSKAAEPAIAALLDENLKKSTEIGIQGTPGFIIGDKIVRGYIPYEELKATIEAARASKS